MYGHWGRFFNLKRQQLERLSRVKPVPAVWKGALLGLRPAIQHIRIDYKECLVLFVGQMGASYKSLGFNALRLIERPHRLLIPSVLVFLELPCILGLLHLHQEYCLFQNDESRKE